LCINKPELVERAEIIRDKGTNRKQFFRGQVDKYTWVDHGSSYVPSELCSAFLYAQLEMLDMISHRRRKIFEGYRTHLSELESECLVRLPHLPEECESNYHLFYILLPDRQCRDSLMANLRENGVTTVFHYVPLHTSPMGERFGYRPGDLPVTEDMSGRLLRLPCYYDLTEDDQQRVVHGVRSFLQKWAVSKGTVGVAVG
jgi:dTDP-4-amino-4,6-dideoxygalactose transaminase